jgi:anti-anti-sigma factor
MIHREDFEDRTVVRFGVRNLMDVGVVNSIFECLSQIIDDGRRKIVLNLDKVEHLSSFVLGKLLVAKQKVEAAGGRLALCHVSPHIALIFRGPSNPLFDIYDDESAALQSL